MRRIFSRKSDESQYREKSARQYVEPSHDFYPLEDGENMSIKSIAFAVETYIPQTQ